MYPDTFFQWVGYVALVFGLLIFLSFFLWVMAQEKDNPPPDDPEDSDEYDAGKQDG